MNSFKFVSIFIISPISTNNGTSTLDFEYGAFGMCWTGLNDDVTLQMDDFEISETDPDPDTADYAGAQVI